MIVPSTPSFFEEHVQRLTKAGIQSAFQFYNINSYETVERLIRRGIYKGPLVCNWVAIGGGMDAPNIYNMANFLRAIPDGAMLTVESSMLNTLPINMMGIAMGLHVRCGIEDNLWNQTRTGKMTTVQQIKQLVRISHEFGREVANGIEAREILKIGVFYDTVEETLAANGFAPNPKGGHQGLSAQGCGLNMSQPVVLIVPGLRDHVASHWQTLLVRDLEAGGRAVRSVPPMGRDDLDCARRVEAIDRALAGIAEPPIVVAHSGGVIMFVHWALTHDRPIRGTLLATPPDFEEAMPDGYPTIAALQAGAGCRFRASRCRFRASSPPVAMILWDASSASPNWRTRGAAASTISVKSGTSTLRPASAPGLWPKPMSPNWRHCARMPRKHRPA